VAYSGIDVQVVNIYLTPLIPLSLVVSKERGKILLRVVKPLLYSLNYSNCTLFGS
jgi:hypothetical protein